MKWLLFAAASSVITENAQLRMPPDTQSVLNYSDCQIAAEDKLDDFKMDAPAVAHAITEACERKYWAMVSLYARKGQRAFIGNYDFALSTVEARRSFRRLSAP